jgi:hypothetical protein
LYGDDVFGDVIGEDNKGGDEEHKAASVFLCCFDCG